MIIVLALAIAIAAMSLALYFILSTSTGGEKSLSAREASETALQYGRENLADHVYVLALQSQGAVGADGKSTEWLFWIDSLTRNISKWTSVPGRYWINASCVKVKGGTAEYVGHTMAIYDSLKPTQFHPILFGDWADSTAITSMIDSEMAVRHSGSTYKIDYMWIYYWGSGPAGVSNELSWRVRVSYDTGSATGSVGFSFTPQGTLIGIEEGY